MLRTWLSSLVSYSVRTSSGHVPKGRSHLHFITIPETRWLSVPASLDVNGEPWSLGTRLMCGLRSCKGPVEQMSSASGSQWSCCVQEGHGPGRQARLWPSWRQAPWPSVSSSANGDNCLPFVGQQDVACGCASAGTQSRARGLPARAPHFPASSYLASPGTKGTGNTHSLFLGVI